MAIIDLQSRSASVRAVTDCRAIKINRATLHELYRKDLEQYAIIMMNMGREVSRRLREVSERLFEVDQSSA
jgi:CRP-like cAMP-binding protein